MPSILLVVISMYIGTVLYLDRPKTPPARWVNLFDGRRPDEWRGFRSREFPKHIWSVKEGALYRKKTSSEERRDLVTRREFQDFALEFEWKISPGGNSGLKYLVREDRPASWDRASYEHSRRDLIRRGLKNSREFKTLTPRKPFFSPMGFEFQVLDDARNGDAKNGGDRVTGALYDILPRSVETRAPAGVYNRGKILVRGTLVQHWVNGVKVLEFDRLEERVRKRIAASKFAKMPGFGLNRRGRITLQDHGDEVWFRRIRVREL